MRAAAMRTEATIARGEMRFASGRPVAMIADSRPRYSPVGCPLRLSSALAKSRSSNVIESLLSQARGAAPRGRSDSLPRGPGGTAKHARYLLDRQVEVVVEAQG